MAITFCYRLNSATPVENYHSAETASQPSFTQWVAPRKLNRLYGVYTDVGKISRYGFRFRRGEYMKARKLWAWVVLLVSITFVLQFSLPARAQDQGQQDQPQQDQAQPDQAPP